MHDTHFGLTLVTPPSVEPLSLVATKVWLRIDTDDTSQDAVVSLLITQARQRCERVTGRALVTQTWLQTLDRFPGEGLFSFGFHGRDHCEHDDVRHSDRRTIRLFRPPLQSVTSLAYVDAGGITQSLDPTTGFQTDTVSEPGRLLPNEFSFWPQTRTQTLGAVRITYQVGYGDDASDVPGEIVQALMTHVAYCFRNREQQDDDYLDRLFGSFSIGTMH